MMIQVTASIGTDGLFPYQVDETDPTGLSEQGFLEVLNAMLRLGFEDVDFKAVPDESETVPTVRMKKK